MGDFRMPSLGADMEEGTVIEWRVQPGDAVRRGDVVAVIDTEKADIDAEVFEDGEVAELLVGIGETVPVGTVLARIKASVSSSGRGPELSEARPAAPSARPPRPTQPAPTPPHHGPAVRSPLVRRLADDLHVDLERVVGTGVGGMVTRADVQAAARPQPAGRRPRVSPRARRLAAAGGIAAEDLVGSGPGGAVIGRDLETRAVERGGAPVPDGAVRPRREPRQVTMQRQIASLMERSNREIPHYWVQRDLDFSAASRWLDAHNASAAPAERILPAAVLLAATARAAAAVPAFNGWWEDGSLRTSSTVDLGVVVSLRSGGLLVPVLHGAEQLPVADLMARLTDVVGRARRDRLRSSDLGTPSITVTNLGDRGADAVHGTIYPPQVALVGIGPVREVPWAQDGMLDVRPVVTVSVAGDHRATDGHQASRLLAELADLIARPEVLESAPE
jgi:pyruvate dehydrogenase E2 component (dihydrolipoamide acetyltransferase)